MSYHSRRRRAPGTPAALGLSVLRTSSFSPIAECWGENLPWRWSHLAPLAPRDQAGVPRCSNASWPCAPKSKFSPRALRWRTPNRRHRPRAHPPAKILIADQPDRQPRPQKTLGYHRIYCSRLTALAPPSPYYHKKKKQRNRQLRQKRTSPFVITFHQPLPRIYTSATIKAYNPWRKINVYALARHHHRLPATSCDNSLVFHWQRQP